MRPTMMPEVAQPLDIDSASDKEDRDRRAAERQQTIDQERGVNSRGQRGAGGHDRRIEADADRPACDLEHVNDCAGG